MDFQARYNTQGFSLIEVMVVVGLLALFAGAVGPVYRTVQTKTNLDIAVAGVASAYRRAQAASQSGNADANWGVKFFTTHTVVFAGNSYAVRQASYDEKLDFPDDTTVSGNTEVVFTKFTGLPQATGTTTVTNSFGSKNLIVNAQGTVTY